MSVVRRFLVAPALVRLIRKERGGARITEGYFAAQAGRTSFVRVEGQACHLVLINRGADGTSAEERTEVPRAHGDALLDVCPGKGSYDRTSLTLSGREVFVDRYVSPGALDLVAVAFDTEADAKGFAAPAWFGRDVSDEAAYERQALALQGPPKGAPEVALSNAALDAVLDLIEPRFGFNRYGASGRAEGGEEPARRTGQPSAPPSAAKPAGPEAAKAEASREPSHAEALKTDPAKPEPAKSESAKSEPARTDAPAPTPQRPDEPARAPAVSAAAVAVAPEGAPPGDARIEDVIESLSQALGAAIQQPQPEADEDPTAAFERWTPRPRRTQPT